MARTSKLGSFTMLLLGWLHPAQSAVYYVDHTGGSDNNQGTSPTGAWQSLARIRQTHLYAGDFVLLKRGETWGEQLQINASGSDGAPITFGAYATGNMPAIDGTSLTLATQTGLVNASSRSYLVLDGLEVRNSQRDGVVPYMANFLAIRNCRIHDNQFNGILAFNGSNTTIEDSEIYANSLDPTNSYAGILIDGNAGPQAGFLISNNYIHDNIGGQGWQSANGIYLGHTGSSIPNLTNVAIAGNDISRNGNPNQNQAGRGISGSFSGNVSVTANTVSSNASAGIYLGDVGLVLTINISQNVFYNNALRQFGGITNGSALASENLVLVDNPNITGMGAEIGGMGPWTLVNNMFAFTTQTSDAYRGFIRINNPEQDSLLQSDYNTFYSAGPNRWLQSDGAVLSFAIWQAAGYDAHSANPKLAGYNAPSINPRRR
jgi:hypothetical protein